MNLVDRVEALLEPVLKSYGYAIARVNLSAEARPVLQIMIEHIDGSVMVVDDCAHMSRVISAHLEVENPIRGTYVLEVSSPGIDRPLSKPKDFQRFCGEEISLSLLTPIKGRKRFIGHLTQATEDEIVLRYKPDEDSEFLEEIIKIRDIKTAKLHVDFAKE